VTIVSGAGKRHRAADYGCPAHEFRGTCTNTRRIASDVLETQLLEKLQREVLSPTAINYVVERVEVEFARQLSAVSCDLETIRRRKSQLESELENLTRAVAGGLNSESISKGIADRECEIASVRTKILNHANRIAARRLPDLRKFVEGGVAELRKLISENNASATRMELAKHLKEIVLLPGDGGEIKYSGDWNLLGNGGIMGGAEGQNRTGYAGLFRAALYQ
jgi:hypothetical protein